MELHPVAVDRRTDLAHARGVNGLGRWGLLWAAITTAAHCVGKSGQRIRN